MSVGSSTTKNAGSNVLSILHVEDSLDDQVIMRRALEGSLRAGFSLEAVSSPAEALSALGERAFSLILLDFELPGMNGLEFMKELKRRGIGTPVLLVTGQHNPLIAAGALNKGAKRYIPKDKLRTNPETIARAIIESMSQDH